MSWLLCLMGSLLWWLGMKNRLGKASMAFVVIGAAIVFYNMSDVLKSVGAL